ncbi:MAG TPA: type II secretion system protein GspM [Candidatus Binataceae bacterium]|nr:type II secretion system protein GspM [Candidatus Binataceae bacterium]
MLRDYLDRMSQWIRATLGPQLDELRGRINPLIAQGRARYDKLESRERILVQIGAALAAIFLLYNLIYSPIVDLSIGLDQEIVAREHDLTNVRRLAANYAAVKTDLESAEHSTVPQSKDFSLFSVVESAFTKSVGHDKIASITPADDKKLADGLVQYRVQLKLENVSLAQIVDALYSVRTLPVPVGIENLRVQRRSQNTHAYDVDITCVALGHNA